MIMGVDAMPEAGTGAAADDVIAPSRPGEMWCATGARFRVSNDSETTYTP